MLPRASQTKHGQPLQATLRAKPNREAENLRKGAVIGVSAPTRLPNPTWPASASYSESQTKPRGRKSAKRSVFGVRAPTRQPNPIWSASASSSESQTKPSDKKSAKKVLSLVKVRQNTRGAEPRQCQPCKPLQVPVKAKHNRTL